MVGWLVGSGSVGKISKQAKGKGIRNADWHTGNAGDTDDAISH